MNVVRIIPGDALSVLQTMPAESVHCCVTSPPYFGLRDYGVPGQIGLEGSIEEYIAAIVEVFREVRRVLRPDGTLWLNLGDSYTSGSRGGYDSDDKLPERGMNCRPDTPQGLKPKDLIGVPWRVAFALQADGWYLRSDIIWCLSGGTWVYAKTPKGEMPMTIKDLVRLDPRTVQLWNGRRWTQVLGWSPTPRPENAIEIVLRSGERIGCTPGHIWPTRRGNVRADELRVGDVLLTCQLPEPEEPVGDGLDDEDTGWLIGMYLAEGSRSGDTVQIASHVKEVSRFERLERIARSLHGSARFHRTSEHGATINLHGRIILGVIEHYVGGRTAKDKHLKPTVWQRSNRFLRAVLQGYLEGDGHYDAENDRWRLGFARNYALEQSLRTLCARLGVSLRLKPTFATYQGGCVPVFRGEIRFNRSDHHNTRPDSEIVEIRRSRARQFWDIGVADEPHLFALASGVLTHNSKPNPMPESVTDRPTKSHEYVFLMTKNERYFYDNEAIREPQETADKSRFYGVDAPKGKTPTWGIDGSQSLKEKGRAPRLLNPAGRNKRDVWTISTKPYAEAHFATFPPELPEVCIKAGTSEKGCCPQCGAGWERIVEREIHTQGAGRANIGGGFDHGWEGTPRGIVHARTIGWRPTCSCNAGDPVPAIVLDPFGGAGTTGMVAVRLLRDAVLIELNPRYCEMAARRIRRDGGMFVGVQIDDTEGQKELLSQCE